MSDQSHNAILRYARWLTAHPWRVMAGACLLAASTGALLYFLQLNADYAVFFSEDDPKVQQFSRVLDEYTSNSSVFVTVTARDGDVFSEPVLRAINDLTEGAWDFSGVVRVDSLTNYRRAEWIDGQLQVGPLIAREDFANESRREAARAAAIGDPLLRNRLINESGSVTGVNIQVGDRLGGMVERVEAAAQDIETRFPEVDLRLTGGVMLNHGFRQATVKDLLTMTPIVSAVLIFTMAYLIRSIVLTFVTYGVVMLAVASAMGVASVLGFEISGPVAPSPIMVMTLGVANCVHILTTFNFQREQRHDTQAALIETLRVNTAPIFVTNLTTCMGFFSMSFNAVPPIKVMATVTSLGVLFAFIYSITILPAAICLLPLREPRREQAQARTRVIVAFGDWVLRHRRALLATSAAVSIALMAFIPRLTFKNEYVNFLKESESIRRDTEYTAEHLRGIFDVTWPIAAEGPGGVTDPEYLRGLDAFAGWLSAQPGVTHVSSLAETLKRLNRLMHRDDPAYDAIPESREEVERLLMLYESALPEGLSLRSTVNDARSASLLVATTDNLGSEAIAVLASDAERWMVETFPVHMRGDPTGPWILFADISRKMQRGMALSTPLALVLVSITLIFALRSLRFGLISLLPNLLPLGAALGCWGLFGRHLDIAMAGVLGMGIGIIVDDSVHFLSKYLRARKEEGMNPEDAVRYAFASVGMALVVTSFVLTAGFLTLFASRFTTSVNMGSFTTLVILFALAGDFLFLPALLVLLDRD